MMRSALHVQHLSVSRSGRTILSDLSLTVDSGEFVAIVGKSGAGKSTLLHTLAGHLPLTGKLSIPQKIGMVFQERAIFPWLTVEGNIGFGLTMEPGAKTGIIRESLRISGLTDKAYEYPRSLSGGEQQRVAIARALVRGSDLLLMDEPFGSLDVSTRAEMQRWLLDVWQTYGTTVVFVTHDIEEAITLATRVLVLREGTFVDDIDTSSITFHSRHSPFAREMNERITACLT